MAYDLPPTPVDDLIRYPQPRPYPTLVPLPPIPGWRQRLSVATAIAEESLAELRVANARSEARLASLRAADALYAAGRIEEADRIIWRVEAEQKAEREAVT